MNTEFNFECDRCGECCSGLSKTKGIILFPEDIKRISKMLNLSVEIFKKLKHTKLPVSWSMEDEEIKLISTFFKD
jgi:Fe-S-cluster containining protein